MKIAIQMSKSSQDLIREQNRIALFWLAGNSALILAEKFVAAIETLEDRGVRDYDVKPQEVIIEILDFYDRHRD